MKFCSFVFSLMILINNYFNLFESILVELKILLHVYEVIKNYFVIEDFTLIITIWQL